MLRRSFSAPLPIAHLGHVLAVLVDVVLVLDELGLEPFFEGEASFAGLRETVEFESFERVCFE